MTRIKDQIAELTPREHAIAAVCPNSGKPMTVYEINMVNMLTEFAERVLRSTPSSDCVMVPKEPTEAMRTAGCIAINDIYAKEGGWCGLKAAQDQMIATWGAMLAAAPATSQRDCAALDSAMRAEGREDAK